MRKKLVKLVVTNFAKDSDFILIFTYLTPTAVNRMKERLIRIANDEFVQFGLSWQQQRKLLQVTAVSLKRFLIDCSKLKIMRWFYVSELYACFMLYRML